MEIRPESPADFVKVEALLRGAFPTGAEADLVKKLRAEGDAEIALVAAQRGGIAGHVMLSRMEVRGGGRAYRALGLGPVAVAQAARGAGIGGKLIEKGLAIARERGFEIVFLVGEPGYYRRFGFAARTAEPFVSPYAGPYFLALVLDPDLPLPREGRAEYAPAFAEMESG
ncbi:MAG: GNAT family N-acetyltransferase [Sphingomonadaceae bacterium]